MLTLVRSFWFGSMWSAFLCVFFMNMFLDADILFCSGMGKNVDAKRCSGRCFGFGLDDVKSSSLELLSEIFSSLESKSSSSSSSPSYLLSFSSSFAPTVVISNPSSRIALSILLTTSFLSFRAFSALPSLQIPDPSLPFLSFLTRMRLFQRFVPCRRE